jgi:hypothetical protein
LNVPTRIHFDDQRTAGLSGCGTAELLVAGEDGPAVRGWSVETQSCSVRIARVSVLGLRLNISARVNPHDFCARFTYWCAAGGSGYRPCGAFPSQQISTTSRLRNAIGPVVSIRDIVCLDPGGTGRWRGRRLRLSSITDRDVRKGRDQSEGQHQQDRRAET